MSFKTQANDGVNAVGLEPPLRQAQVAKDVGMKQAIGRNIGLQERHQILAETLDLLRVQHLHCRGHD